MSTARACGPGESAGATFSAPRARGSLFIPVHGGSERLGIYNAVESAADGAGAREVLAGTSYVQVVGFDANGPQAQALLTYSQSPDPVSPHAADQTPLFSRKQWIRQPFTLAEIDRDPELRRVWISC